MATDFSKDGFKKKVDSAKESIYKKLNTTRLSCDKAAESQSSQLKAVSFVKGFFDLLQAEPEALNQENVERLLVNILDALIDANKD